MLPLATHMDISNRRPEYNDNDNDINGCKTDKEEVWNVPEGNIWFRYGKCDNLTNVYCFTIIYNAEQDINVRGEANILWKALNLKISNLYNGFFLF